MESAIANGHKVTLFFRGKDSPELFEGQVEKILGDRDGELNKLAGRHWDVCFDTPGYYPRVVRASCEFLRGAVSRYLFISSISVYDQPEGAETIDEDTPVGKLEGEVVEEFSGATYGPLKALCEKEVQNVYGSDATIVRPGLIVGSYDTTDRFTYYPWRLMQGGRMLCGGVKNSHLQIIDARDIGRFCVSLAEQDAGGTYNVCGPERPYHWEEWISRAKQALRAGTELVWADHQKLIDAGLQEGVDLPLYHGDSREGEAFMSVDNSRALEKGLTFTPLEDTVKDTAEWIRSRGDVELKVGMSLERERALMDAAGV